MAMNKKWSKVYEDGWAEDDNGMVFRFGRVPSVADMHVFTLAKLEGRLRPLAYDPYSDCFLKSDGTRMTAEAVLDGRIPLQPSNSPMSGMLGGIGALGAGLGSLRQDQLELEKQRFKLELELARAKTAVKLERHKAEQETRPSTPQGLNAKARDEFHEDMRNSSSELQKSHDEWIKKLRSSG